MKLEHGAAYSLKIVPKATPNADGEWISVTVDASKVPNTSLTLNSWPNIEMFFQPYIPDGFFLVKVSRA